MTKATRDLNAAIAALKRAEKRYDKAVIKDRAHYGMKPPIIQPWQIAISKLKRFTQ